MCQEANGAADEVRKGLDYCHCDCDSKVESRSEREKGGAEGRGWVSVGIDVECVVIWVGCVSVSDDAMAGETGG